MKNLVKIKTAFNTTTGFLFKCEYGSQVNGVDYKKFIVFTNRHLLNGLIEETDFLDYIENKKEEINNFFKLDIYINNIRIPSDSIEIKDYFFGDCSQEVKFISSDIISFLIKIKYKCIDLDNLIYKDDLNYDMEILTNGYPSILSSDIIEQRIKLKGNIKPIIENNSCIGRYSLEEYHHYQKISDLKIVSGLSGAPVFIIENNHEYIIGMNVSIPKHSLGENPHRLVNFIKIKHILKFLKENGVIIYEIMQDSTVRIKWINGVKIDEQKSKTILVLGGSGAGKSSFIKSFAYNGGLIDSSGDGQTTRSTIKYHFSRYTEDKVVIQLLNKSEFVEIRKSEIIFDIIEHICTKFFNFPKQDIYQNKYCYLVFLDEDIKLKDINKSNEWQDTEEQDIIDIYLGKIDEFCNKNKSNNNFNIKNCLEETEKILNVKKGVFDIHELEYVLDIKTIEEDNETNDKSYKDIFKKCISQLPQKFDEIGEQIQKFLDSYYEELYSFIMPKVKSYIKLSEIKIDWNKIEIFDLNNNNRIVSEFLKVVTNYNSKSKNSLSSLAKNIDIYDSFTEAYSFVFEDRNIDAITFIDTRGLDHIGLNANRENIIRKIFDDEKNSFEERYGIKSEDGIDSVIYLKKLDSGKPTELSEIIPLIYKVSPQIALYTIFTGVDIFYQKENIIIDWEFDDIYMPKSVEYLKSEDFKELLNNKLSSINIRTKRIEIIRSVMCRNIIGYCANDKTIDFYMDSNKRNITRFIESIIIKEYNLVQYIDKEDIENKKDKICAKIEGIIKELFEKATKVEFGNSNAPYTTYKYLSGGRWKDSYDFGYYGYYADNRNRIDLCFNDSYNLIFSKNNKYVTELIDIFSDEIKDKIESILIGMKNSFLGKSRSMYKIWEFDSVEEESDFIKIIKEAYKRNSNFNTTKEGHQFDPFNIKEAYFVRKIIDGHLEKDTIVKELKDELKKISELSKDIKELYYSIKENTKNNKDNAENSEIENIYSWFKEKNGIPKIDKKEKLIDLQEFMYKYTIYKDVDYNIIESDINNLIDILEKGIKGKSGKIDKLCRDYYIRNCFDFKKLLEDNNDSSIIEKIKKLFYYKLVEEVEQNSKRQIKDYLYAKTEVKNNLEKIIYNVKDTFMVNNISSDDSTMLEKVIRRILK